MPEATVRLNTLGLHCPSCSMLVRMQLEDIPGVAEVKSDHVSGITEVTFDPDQASVDDLIGAIVAAGYGAELAE